jgi:aryl-alcohol dehydrogenase-like predicted oxidoreductase
MYRFFTSNDDRYHTRIAFEMEGVGSPTDPVPRLPLGRERMHTRRLGNSPLHVSAIGLGCWGMSHAYGRADERESLATLENALDRGINFLDTADVYGDGHNEMLMARVLKTRRPDAVVATKFGFVGDEHGAVDVCGRPDYVRTACDRSLKRLGIDVIDLYYLHRRDPRVPIEETVGAMADLVAAGKVRAIGLSEVSADTLRRAHAVHPVAALQSEYSLWQRDVEPAILPACRALGVSLVPYCPLGRGFLTGTVCATGDLNEGDYRRAIPRFADAAMQRNQVLIDRLNRISQASGHSPAQLALAWLLARDPSIVPIPGMKHRRYLTENAAAGDIRLRPEIMDALDGLNEQVAGARHNAQNLRFVET